MTSFIDNPTFIITQSNHDHVVNDIFQSARLSGRLYYYWYRCHQRTLKIDSGEEHVQTVVNFLNGETNLSLSPEDAISLSELWDAEGIVYYSNLTISQYVNALKRFINKGIRYQQIEKKLIEMIGRIETFDDRCIDELVSCPIETLVRLCKKLDTSNLLKIAIRIGPMGGLLLLKPDVKVMTKNDIEMIKQKQLVGNEIIVQEWNNYRYSEDNQILLKELAQKEELCEKLKDIQSITHLDISFEKELLCVDHYFHGIFNYFKTESQLDQEVQIQCSRKDIDWSQHTNWISRCINNPDGIDGSILYSSPSDQHGWIIIKFIETRIKLESYSIRTNNRGPENDHLSSWVIEGSNNGERWFPIDSKKNCHDLNRVPSKEEQDHGVVAHFKVNHIELAQFIRLQVTGPNHDGTYGINIRSIEFFGKVIRLQHLN